MSGIAGLTRRSMLKTFGAVGAASLLRPALATGQPAPTDADIFNFALNLESLEAEYYLRGTTGEGMSAADAGTTPGQVLGASKKVSFKDDDLRQFLEEVAQNELAHVRFYRKQLGAQAVSRPTIDIGGFAAAAKAAGLGDNFDPFANEMNFLLGGMLMEDVGVTAYKGGCCASSISPTSLGSRAAGYSPKA
jgi:hypothetical protein